MSRTALVGGMLIDGSGAPAVRGDLLFEGALIKEVGRFPIPDDAAVVRCEGLTVAPGLIDAHSHSDLQVLQNRPEKVRQGVTTEIVGNCGFSPYPAAAEREPLHEFANGIFCGEGNWGWPQARPYLDACASSNLHVESLVGHGTLRIFQAGTRLGALGEQDLDAMEGLLDEALSGGACGMSTGLMYSPGASAPPDELERLCRVVARRGKIYTSHMRDYSGLLLEAVDEQIDLARRTGCRLQISHFQAVGERNWHLQPRALERIEQAARSGIDVAFDCYPYVAGSTVMTQLLPQWAMEGGTAALLARLAGSERAMIAAQTEEALAQGWNNIYVSAVATEENQSLVGQSIADIAKSWGATPTDTVFDLLRQESARVNMLEMNQSEANLREALTHPLALVISDGFYVKGRPHPRLHGTFPHLLGSLVRERGWLQLEEAVRKVTALPARRFGITRRGFLAPGNFADVVAFDAAAIQSPATYDSPEQAPLGIAHVFREGVRQ